MWSSFLSARLAQEAARYPPLVDTIAVTVMSLQVCVEFQFVIDITTPNYSVYRFKGFDLGTEDMFKHCR